MAKTRTHPKPATAKKTEAAGSAAPDGAADIQMIPLDQLEPSPLNVRKVAASASDDTELLASIRETGIKQNLVVHALSEKRFSVVAGGRRLKALKQLAEDGVIPADHPVPCLVEDERNAILTSATENLQRAARGAEQAVLVVMEESDKALHYSELAEAMAGVAMRTCEILGTLLSFGSETRLSALDPAEKQAAGQAGFNVLRDGKAALKDVLLGMVPPENGARQNYSKIYGPFYEWLTDQDGDAGFSPIMDIMRDVITDNYVVRPGMTILGTVIEEQAKFSFHGIKGNFKLGTKRMRDELLARGLAREDPRWPDSVILDRPLDRALIDEISRSIEENINLQEAAQRLGLSEELFRKLVYDGLIPRRGYRQLRNHQYDPIFLDRFLATVTQGADIIDSVPEDHVLALQAGQIVRARSSEILHLLATRKVPCAGLLRGKTGLAGAIVHLDTLKNAVQTISFSGLTYREMYQKLRVSSPTLRYLLDQGFLTTYRGKNPATLMETEIISQVSIDAFLQQYVTLGILAEACGQNANSVRFHLLDAGVEKIPIKHGLGAIYRRKEAEAVLIELGLLRSLSE
ncbi:ParB/Srx family N-terminal domain-containing protein [Celeribacter ethanolicus]|nr:ParB/RepB/Spo0J family partition protein [Celeribacter ethanolicus]